MWIVLAAQEPCQKEVLTHARVPVSRGAWGAVADTPEAPPISRCVLANAFREARRLRLTRCRRFIAGDSVRSRGTFALAERKG